VGRATRLVDEAGRMVIIPRPQRWRFFAHQFEGVVHDGGLSAPILSLEEIVEKYRDPSIPLVPGVCTRRLRICTLHRPSVYRRCSWCHTKGSVFSLNELWEYY
jgi:hypothetical protein